MHDSEAAERSIRRLAALTNDEQTRDVRAAAVAVIDAFDRWRASPAWRRDVATDRLVPVVERARQALAELPAGGELSAVVDVVAPLLNLWWPGHPEPAVRVDEAIERLRYLAMHRPYLVDQAGRMVATGTAAL